MRFIIFFFIILMAGGGWYVWENNSQVRSFVEEKLSYASFRTLEIRYTANALMESQKRNLIKGSGYVFLEPELQFYPYLLMQVKYTENAQTEEASLLFGLYDGEMVIDGGTWEQSRGYEDCLKSCANQNDFKLIRGVVSQGGSVEKEKLYTLFQEESPLIDKWIASALHKKLLVNHGTKLRLHLATPKLPLTPVTKFEQAVVNYPAKNSQKVKGKYSSSEVKKFLHSAFGNDFAIRTMEEVYLPVYSLRVQNPDGSTLTTLWNAITGKQL